MADEEHVIWKEQDKIITQIALFGKYNRENGAFLKTQQISLLPIKWKSGGDFLRAFLYAKAGP